MARYNGVRALVLGLEVNGLSVVRSLGRSRVLTVGVDSDLVQVTALSKYLLSRVQTEDIRESALIDTLIELAADGQTYALFPTMDATVFTLSENRERLPENLICRLPDKETVRKLMHKGSFRDLAQTLDLPSLGYAVVQDKEGLEKALDSIRFPLVIKSTMKKMGPAPKAAVVQDARQALEAYLTQGEGEVILEEWIPGQDGDVYFCLQYYDRASQCLASFMGRKIRQWPPQVGGTASAEPVSLPELEQKTTEFFTTVGFQGLCSMEYKYDGRDGQYYAIEPTVGRTDFQSGLAPANGVNIPLTAFLDMAGLPPRQWKPRRSMKWVHSVADTRSAQHYMERGELTRQDWKKSLAGPRVGTLFAVDDPGPWVSDLFRRLVGRLKRVFLNRGGDP